MKKHTAVVLGAGSRGRTHIHAFLANSDRFDLVAARDHIFSVGKGLGLSFE